MESKDNWENVDQTMKCGTCFYYINTRCRRHAPTINGYPAVFKTDWCGDHKLSKQTITNLEINIDCM